MSGVPLQNDEAPGARPADYFATKAGEIATTASPAITSAPSHTIEVSELRKRSSPDTCGYINGIESLKTL